MTTVLLFVLLLVVTSVLGMLVAEEAQAQWNRVCRYLVTRAVHVLPPSCRERYREEWLAELDVHPGGPISHMWWAVSLLISRRRIAVEVRSMSTETSESEIFEVRTVAEASKAAARILELATQQADELIAEARAMAKRRRRRLDRARGILGIAPGAGHGPLGAEAPTEVSTRGWVQVPDDASDAAARLMQIATTNADELIAAAKDEAGRILKAASAGTADG